MGQGVGHTRCNYLRIMVFWNAGYGFDPRRLHSNVHDIFNACDGHDLGRSDENSLAVAFHTRFTRGDHIVFSGGARVPQIVQIRVMNFQESIISAHELPQADEGAFHVDDHNLTDHFLQHGCITPLAEVLKPIISYYDENDLDCKGPG